MSSLWIPNDRYIEFNFEIHHTAEIFDTFRREQYIPYIRKYSSLNNDQVLALIKDAKYHHWQALDLSCCKLAELPDELWELNDLRILYIGNVELPEDIKEENANTITWIPRKIEQLKNLQALCLFGLSCSFEKDSPLDLPNLHYLNLFDSGFNQIPNALLIPTIEGLGFCCPDDHLSPEFTSLIHLKEVYLTGSKIKTLPDDIDRLKELKALFLWRTRIAFLPSSMLSLQSLNKLKIHGTPLEQSVPPEILKQSAQEIIRYILGQQSKAPKEYFNESKMIIVGQGAVGKTSLLKRLVEKTFSEEKSTEGINISKWEYRFGKKDIRLNIWDFGGQEIYHATHQFFLTRRSLYLLVWDVLAEKEHGRIDYWLRTIQSLAGDSPIIIVVNKCDKGIGRIERLDLKEYQKKYPQIQAILYVSCKDNICIGQLRKLIQKTASSLPLMRVKWLKTWMDVRRKIEQKAINEDSIPYSDYLDICTNSGITDEEEALSLIKYLHDLGIVLYYHDDPLLKNLVILSSEWGTDAVYKIMDEQERRLKGKNGVLLWDDLKHIWKDRKKYPYEYYPHLLNLMEKFQLAFRIDSKSYLVAELLNNEALDLGWDFERLKTLSFRYEYDFLPAGVMTRFIVAANQFLVTQSGAKQCWRKGAYLYYRTAKARVRLYDIERYIQIDVIGNIARDKRELLGRIRDKLDEINGRFSKITITQKIPCSCMADCPYMFDYQQLLNAERKGKKTVECQVSWTDVSLSRLLDGFENKKTRDDNSKYIVYINNASVNFNQKEFLSGVERSISAIAENGPDTSANLTTQNEGSPMSTNINQELIQWTIGSRLYKMAVGADCEDQNTLNIALGTNESERYQGSYALMQAVWRNHPELGVAPDYKLLSELEYGEKFYDGYRDHTTHMFKVFLLGLYLYEKSEKFRAPIKEVLHTDEDFLSVWILTALYHDIGYVIETEDGCWDSEEGDSVIKRFNESLIYPMSNMFPKEIDIGTEKGLQRVARYKVFEADQDSLEKEMERFNSIGSIVKLCTQEGVNPIKAYYDFTSHKRKGREYYDHGIISACMLLYACDEICGYMHEIKKVDGSLHPNQQRNIDNFLSQSDRYRELSYIAAQAIALHNINKFWNQNEISTLYSTYKVTISSYCIPQKELPIAYLLRVCDELQCWDRQSYVSPLGNSRTPLKPDKLSFIENIKDVDFAVKDDHKRTEIVEALKGVLDPPLDQVLTLKK